MKLDGVADHVGGAAFVFWNLAAGRLAFRAVFGFESAARFPNVFTFRKERFGLRPRLSRESLRRAPYDRHHKVG
jgi:hypothetical protein